MSNESSSEQNHPIDIVITWVDGDDPKLSEKRNRFLKGTPSTISSKAHPTRFASINEIRYCVLSIFKFAPFVRNVFIVTDGQDPNLYYDIKTYYPERLNSIRIVDHTEIFEGYEQYLPTFNSISIGHMIWRIKALSDNFVYFNDDTFLIREMQPSDWFVNNKPVLRGQWAAAPHHRILWDKIKKAFSRQLLGKAEYEPRASFHIGQWNSASLLGFRFKYLANSHTPHTVGRKTVADFFSSNRSVMERNISYRFREYWQFTFIALSNHLQVLAGNKHITNPDLAYLQPYNRAANYIDNKIKFCQRNSSIKYLCVQSLDLCKKEQQDKVLGWMDTVLQLESINHL
jgi:hypothetical protein